MGKLIKQLNTEKLENNYSLLVPSIFTRRQFGLLKRKIQQKKLSKVEQVYFSRSISKKLKAIDSLAGLEKKYFVYGEETMIPERKEKAIKLLKKTERNHKNMKILISGSFLYNKKYNDIDVFMVSEYEKEDYWKSKLHFNYLSPGAFGSLFLNSLRLICVANFDLSFFKVKERISLNGIVSKYQEVVNDIFDKNYSWLKIDLRDFILDYNYLGGGVVLNSLQLKNNLDKLLRKKNKMSLVRKMFVYAVLNGSENREIRKVSLNMIKSYKGLIREYKHKKYYQTLINSFKEVLACAG